MAIYAIGDIQGCYDSLRRLLDKIDFNPLRDRLWLVGDLVNRGAHSLEVLRFIKSLGEAALNVLGNHDLHLLMLAEGYSKVQRGDTLEAILRAPDREELLTWLRCQPLMHVEDGYALVHAGLLPQWSVTRARALAHEVEAALQASDYRECLANMWGNEPASWDDNLEGWARIRAVVNAMTRMRFCTPAGLIEFRAKGKLEDAPPGYLPWFAVPGRQSANHVLVTGHWSALGLKLEENLLALDSGCLWGGHLTAVRLADHTVFQVDCSKDDVR